jgi:hypothetical protein
VLRKGVERRKLGLKHTGVLSCVTLPRMGEGRGQMGQVGCGVDSPEKGRREREEKEGKGRRERGEKEEEG